MCGVECHSNLRAFTLIELLIAIALGAFVCIGIFHLYTSLNRLSAREQALSQFAENTRFMDVFVRNKINQARDWSCLSRSPGSLSMPVKGYDSDDALDKLGLTIKTGTDLLQLKECIRLHGKMQYLPVAFFIADTFRFDALNQPIYALFFKVGHHPREELITGMTKFNVLFGVRDRSKNNIRAFHHADAVSNWQTVGAVKINYQLSENIFSLSQKGFLYAGLWHQSK